MAAPSIRRFEAMRSDSVSSNVIVTFEVVWDDQNGRNPITVNLYRKVISSDIDWVTLVTAEFDKSPARRTLTVQNNSDLISYDYRLTADDSKGERDASDVLVANAKQSFVLYKDEAVGILKEPEYSGVDIGDEVHVKDRLNIRGVGDMLKLFSSDPSGEGSINWITGWGADKASIGVEKTNDFEHRLVLENKTSSIDLRTPEMAMVNGEAIVRGDSTVNGRFIKLYDGTMICWIRSQPLIYRTSFQHLSGIWRFPEPFSTSPTVFAIKNNYGGDQLARETQITAQSNSNQEAEARAWASGGSSWWSNAKVNVSMLAIGRWK